MDNSLSVVEKSVTECGWRNLWINLWITGVKSVDKPVDRTVDNSSLWITRHLSTIYPQDAGLIHNFIHRPGGGYLA